MCLTPITLDNGSQVACKDCWQCKRRKVQDYVGRAIAESKLSTKTFAVTLTYGDDSLKEHEKAHAVVLCYKDVQDFLKRLRKNYNVRYIATGEYGTAKSRSHWHIILFFQGDYPHVPMERRTNWTYWKKGFSYFQQGIDIKGFEYCLKYVLKDTNSETSESHFAMSTRPPLGHEFFQKLATQHAIQGLAPQSYFYKFGDVRDYKNRDKGFMMNGKTRENFMSKFIDEWYARYQHPPISDIVDEFIDKNTDLYYTDEELEKRLHYKPVRYIEPWQQPEGRGLLDKTQLVEATYDGIPIYYWEHEEHNELKIYTETQEWVEKRDEVVKTIKDGSVIIKKQKLTEFWNGS